MQDHWITKCKRCRLLLKVLFSKCYSQKNMLSNWRCYQVK